MLCLDFGVDGDEEPRKERTSLELETGPADESDWPHKVPDMWSKEYIGNYPHFLAKI